MKNTFVEAVNRDRAFEYLTTSVEHCNLCPRLCSRKKVLSRLNGNLNSKVVFIAEAPGRLGAECTRIPLYGDRTGDTFEMLLSNIGWDRHDVFITNAILCNPQDENGNNSTPTKNEIENCSYYLSMVLELINPDVIITLGAKALQALTIIRQHNIELNRSVGQIVEWGERKLMPLYHMGPMALIHRSLAKQRSDFIKLSTIVSPKTGLKKKKTINRKAPSLSFKNSPLLDTVMLVLKETKEISFFKLTKMLYLIDFNAFRDFGETITASIYLRLQEGPWLSSLKDVIKSNEQELFSTVFVNKKPYVKSKNYKYNITTLNNKQIMYISNIIDKYKDYSDADIKKAAYLTTPMKYILRREKQGDNMTKVPVLSKNICIVNIRNNY